jgi:putative transposase
MSEMPVVESDSVEPCSGLLSGAVSDEQLIAMLVERARGEGLRTSGEGGLL